MRQVVFPAGALLAAACTPQAPEETFDFRHVDLALAYFETGDEALLEAMGETAAAAHLKAHSDMAGYYAPDATPGDITRALVEDRPSDVTRAAVDGLAAFVRDRPEMQTACLAEAGNYLPEWQGEPITLYATWGYDIGVASPVGVSLNLAHPHFLERPEEVWYYCTHEAHHAGVYRYHPVPAVAGIGTAGELAGLVRYLTFLEGTAVFAAHDIRARNGALEDDADYRALADPVAMEAISRRYNEILDGLAGMPPETPLAEADWQVLDEMSRGDRLWYRHGARMAAAIHERCGPARFAAVIEAGHDAFFEIYARIREDDAPC